MRIRLFEIYTKILKNKVVQNSIWLYFLLFANTVLPLMTIPYVTRVLGKEQYGFYSVALNWIFYLSAIVNYGFDLTGTKQIAEIDKNNKRKIERYVSSVVYAKLYLTCISAIIMIGIIVLCKYEGRQKLCLLILFLSVFGDAIKQTWLFQGLQVMENITVISVVSRILSTILVFSFVHKESLYFYCVIYSGASIFVGIAGMFLTRFNLKIKFCKVDYYEIIERLKEGFTLFTTTITSKVFSGFGITILGIVTDASTVGVYSAIYKIPTVLISCFTPISQALYPYVCTKYRENYFKGKKLVFKIAVFITGFFSVGSILIVCMRTIIIKYAFGKEYINSANLLIPFLIWLCISIFNNFLGTQTLIASGHSKEYSRSFLISGIALIVFTLWSGIIFGMYGIAYAQVAAEFLLMCTNAFYIHKLEADQKGKKDG